MSPARVNPGLDPVSGNETRPSVLQAAGTSRHKAGGAGDGRYAPERRSSGQSVRRTALLPLTCAFGLLHHDDAESARRERVAERTRHRPGPKALGAVQLLLPVASGHEREQN
jgi:hypothetical protein